MELKIFWTDFAKAELRKNFNYLRENASYQIAKNETRKIVFETKRLKKQPEVGQIEPMLAKRSKELRYLTHQTYKIIYCINRSKKRIEIVDIFDTQQLPEKIKRSN